MLIALLLYVAGVVVGPVVPVGVGRVSAVGPEELIDLARPGPLGPITVVGDSVLVGAAYEPSLPTNLAEAGWGPIRFRAGLGVTSGNFVSPTSRFSAANWIRTWESQGWVAPNVVVNLGNNDVGFCRDRGPGCYADTIRHLLDVIGPDATVWWSKITRLYTLQAEADAYNAALDLVATERSNLRVWDWPAAQRAGSVPLAWDAIHLAGASAYRTRSALMSADITAQLARGERTGGDGPLPVAAGAPAEYRPIAPVRVLDTREVEGGRLAAGGQVQLDLSSRVPPGTSAVAVNLTAVDPSTAGFLTAHPCLPVPPTVSSANFAARSTRGALAVLPVTADRRLCVLSSSAADLVVDLQGAFVPVGATGASRLTPQAPVRLADTRQSGRPAVLRVDVPLTGSPAATAVALNLTATDARTPGFVTAFPCGGSVPVVSNLNFGVGETVAGAAFVPLGEGGDVCVFSNVAAAVDLVVDLTGVFAPGAGPGALVFTPAAPVRTYDTRDGTGGWSPVHGAGQVIDVRVAPPTAVAVTGTLTMVAPSAAGFLTAYGCGDTPGTSNVNAPRGQVFANAVTVGLASQGRLCVRAHTATQVVFDTTGWWSPAG